MLPMEFQVNWHFGSGETKNRFSEMAAMAAILDISVRTILATFYLQVTPTPPTKFQVNWFFCLGGKVQNRF